MVAKAGHIGIIDGHRKYIVPNVVAVVDLVEVREAQSDQSRKLIISNVNDARLGKLEPI